MFFFFVMKLHEKGSYLVTRLEYHPTPPHSPRPITPPRAVNLHEDAVVVAPVLPEVPPPLLPVPVLLLEVVQLLVDTVATFCP